MAPPTRPQIEASVALPTYLVEWQPAGTWVDISQYVIDVTGALSTTVNQENPMAFGDESTSDCTVVLDLTLIATTWSQVPIRVWLGFNGNNVRYFTGIVKERSLDEYEMTFNCTGFAELVKTSKGYTKLIYGRPAATKTTVSSIEDPDAVGYTAGIVNYVLWQAGGRPKEQDFSYPTAKFYYSCEQAIFRTEWQWVAGEDLWNEALKLSRAAGGQLYQGVDGVVYYKNPLSFAEGTQTYTYTTDAFTTITEDASTSQQVGEIRCNFTPRYRRPIQEVYRTEKPTLIEAGKSHIFTCETQWPLYSFAFDPNVADLPEKAEQVQASFFDGTKATVAVSNGYLSAVHFESAQKIEITVTNTHSVQSMVVHRLTLYGEPVVAGEQASKVYGSGLPSKQLEDNVYIQTPEHAQRITMLVKDFYGAVRPVRHMQGCPFDPDRFVGEVVGLTFTPWGLTNSPHRICSITHSELGSTMDVDLVPIAGLPVNGDFYIVGNSYTDGTTKQLSY